MAPWNTYPGTLSYGSTADGDSDRRIARIRTSVEPLVAHLSAYDEMRKTYEDRGLSLEALPHVSRHLQQQVVMPGRYRGKISASLHDPKSLRQALDEIGDWDLHLAIRRRESKMPVYYLCRTYSDYWTDYRLIIEDLYLSPDYPLHDSRFVKLMHQSREKYHLRLAPFRPPIKSSLCKDPKKADSRSDRLLRKLGEHIFQCAWHEDQRLAFRCAETLGLPNFKMAIETLYLCLSSDLWTLRKFLEEDIERFFQEVYPQEAILSLLTKLQDWDELEISSLPERALEFYTRLSLEFSALLHTNVPWRRTKGSLPLYKLVFANADRMDIIGRELNEEKALTPRTRRLEQRAADILAEIVTPA